MVQTEEREKKFDELYSSAMAALHEGNSNAASLLSKAAAFAPELWCAKATKISADDEPLALKCFNEVLTATKITAVHALAINEIGRILANRGQNEEALEYFTKAHHLSPQHPGIMSNLGLLNRWNGDLKQAGRWLSRALAVNPWEHAAQLESAFVKMLSGDYAAGFREYEARWRTPGGSLKKVECLKPEWDGAEIRGECNPRSLYVYGEQGSGDIFLMLRYARLIRALGMRQTWVVHTSMQPLVSLIEEIDLVQVSGQEAPEFDCHIPAASLPLMFGTTIDTVPDGIVFQREKIVPKDYGPGLHVGIAWRGSRLQLNDRIRSTNLDQWRPVFNVPGITFHSLQVDGSEEGLLYPELNMESNAADWKETASRMLGLDLVISVDTSVVHAAGSLGVPCWCALHCRPYFVFPLVREDCPWYKTVRLFKQRKEFEWHPVFQNIANELSQTLLSR